MVPILGSKNLEVKCHHGQTVASDRQGLLLCQETTLSDRGGLFLEVHRG